MDGAKKLAYLLEGCGAKYTRTDATEGTLFTVSTGDEQYFVLVRNDDAGIEMWSRYFTPEQAIAATVGERYYTYDEWRAINEAVGDAMEYAHEHAVMYPDKADPLWNIDEYVNRVLEVVYGPKDATVGARDTMGLWPEWEQVLFANVSDEAAQDNLNECVHDLLDRAATVGAGTCHLEECEHDREIPYDLPECDGGWYTEVTYDCDECGYENTDPNIRFCGGCGRKVVSEWCAIRDDAHTS